MRKAHLILPIFLLMTFFGACSDDTTGPEMQEQGDTYTLQDGVEVIDIEDMLDDRTMRFEMNGMTPELWIKKSYVDTPANTPFETNDVLYCQPSQQVQFVVFHKVTAVTKTQRERDYYLVKTVEADLIDVFKDADIHQTIPLDLDDGDNVLPEETVELINGNLTLSNHPLLKKTVGAEVKADITINRGVVEIINPVLKLDIVIKDSKLVEHRTVTTSRIKMALDMSVNMKVAVSETQSKTIFKKKSTAVTMAGPVPVWVDYEFKIDLGIKFEYSASLEFTLDNYVADMTTTSGIVWRGEDDYEAINKRVVHSYSVGEEPDVKVEACITVMPFLKETFSAMLYSVAGPNIWMMQYVAMEGCVGLTVPELTLEYCIDVTAGNKIGGGLNIGFFDNSLLSWNAVEGKIFEKELYHECWPIELAR